MSTSNYDILIVGAGIAGSALAYALSNLPSRKYRIALLERSLAEPDRIVGELLQPGGVEALKSIGMAECLEGIGAVPVRGYCVVNKDKQVHIPYPTGHEGRSFHHGRFIMSLRKKAREGPGVDLIEATATELIECPISGRAIGVWTKKGDEARHGYMAKLVIIADGCFSNFRNVVFQGKGAKATTCSHFVGAILKGVKLPIDKHGTVALVRGSGPVLLYQIEEDDTRILMDVKAPLPSDLKSHILNNIVPELPANLRPAIRDTINNDRLRRMPNSFLPPVQQGKHTKEGVILLGDAWNMRHPLTGGGMTVALNDVVKLVELLKTVDDINDWGRISHVLRDWHWSRKPLASTINILSVALYDLFRAEDENLDALREGCFKYFELGGRCVNDPVSLLSGVVSSPVLLITHFFAVAFYAIWVMFTHPRLVKNPSNPKAVQLRRASLDEYPALVGKSFVVLWTAFMVVAPLVRSEL